MKANIHVIEWKGRHQDTLGIWTKIAFRISVNDFEKEDKNIAVSSAKWESTHCFRQIALAFSQVWVTQRDEIIIHLCDVAIQLN